MKRTEYIDAARQALARYDEAYAEDFIRLIEEHFNEGADEGKSEDELCKELGPIENVLEELDQAIGEALRNKDVEYAPVVGSREVNKDNQGFDNAGRNGAHPLTNIVATQNIDTDGVEITRIKADLLFADVRIVRTSDLTPSIRLHEDSATTDEWRIEERVEGDTYFVKLVSANQNEKALFKRFMNVVATPDICFILQVPESITNLDFTGTSGDIYIDGLKASRFDLVTASGDVDVRNVYADELRLVTTSGDIDAANMFATEALKLTSTSGDVEVEAVSAKHVSVKSTSGDVNIEESSAETLEVSSTSGDVELERCKAIELAMYTVSGDPKIYDSAAQSAVLSSTSGDVEAKNTPMNELTANTVSGDLYLNLCRDMDGTINTMSGDVKIRVNNENRGLKVTFSSMSGAANISYGGECRRIEKNGTFAVGDESTKLNIRTMSGSANIN